MSNEADKAVPGVVIGTVFGAILSPALPIVLGAAAVGGIISYLAYEKEEQKK